MCEKYVINILETSLELMEAILTDLEIILMLLLKCN